MNINIPKPVFVFLLVFLNAIPLYGVFHWGWESFDLIFLYWLENLIIGAIMILRILIRPFSHGVEITLMIFMVPFFTVHYGMFCYGHGIFIVSLFGKGLEPGLAGLSIPEIILPLIQAHHLLLPLLGLLAFQILDWVRDVSERGLGSDGIKQLTIAPYRRIVVLHITIIASGFALGALHEPTVGLLLLVVFKTVVDIYHWHKDEQLAVKESVTDSSMIDPQLKRKVDAFLANPKITINGKETRYNSYAELKASKHYGLMKGMLRMVGGSKQLQAIEAYIEEQEQKRAIPAE